MDFTTQTKINYFLTQRLREIFVYFPSSLDIGYSKHFSLRYSLFVIRTSSGYLQRQHHLCHTRFFPVLRSLFVMGNDIVTDRKNGKGLDIKFQC